MRRAATAVISLVVLAVTPACSGGRYHVTAVFDDVGDLQRRGSVQVADVRIGRIEGVKLTKDFKAEVTLAIDKGRKIPKRSQALLRTTSLLGEKFVELRPLGDPAAGPYLADGDRVTETAEAPELEFVAQEAVTVLGAVAAGDVATLVETGAEAFGGRGPELGRLVHNLATVTADFASRSADITRIIDGLDTAAGTLAAGSPQVDRLLVELAGTTKILAEHRQRAVNALRQLNRLAAVQGDILDRYGADLDRQIKQVDAIVAAAASQSREVDVLLGWLNTFVLGLPKVVPGDFTQVFMWLIPAGSDPRVGQP
ncbi:MAG TPA: MlaD family protein [Acidimicrobiales bacterium]|nr:MlaD family protein [Acidimicrobiales bacterium]